MIKKLFFQDDKIESSIKFWTLLGPFFLLITTLLSSNQLSLIALLGIFLIFRFRLKGFYLSTAFLLLFSAYSHKYLQIDHFFNFAIEISAFLGFFITANSLEEISTSLDEFQSKKDETIKDLKQKIETTALQSEKNVLEQTFDANDYDVDQKNLEIQNLKQEIEDKNTQIHDLISRKDFLLNELDQKEKEIDEKSNQVDELFEKISFLKDEEFLKQENEKLKNDFSQIEEKLKNQLNEFAQANVKINEQNIKIKTLQNQLASFENVDELKENINLSNQEIEKLKTENEKLKLKLSKGSRNVDSVINDEKIKNLLHVNALYLQLKKQFEDKQLVLHKTRKDLFSAQEKLTAFVKENQNDFSDFTETEKKLSEDLNEAIEEMTYLQLENEKLKDIISLLNVKSKTKSNSRESEKVKVTEQDLPF
ncbi:MAG: hypothetical protein JXA94_06160 [Parachlamydiales bacterium]|nr:hypothetical protein [Parachlamydiales bacterium]